MQINSIWLPELRRYGYTAAILQDDGCANVLAAAFILARRLQQAGWWRDPDPEAPAFWSAVATYHSYTERHNRRYARSVRAHWQRYRPAARRLVIDPS